MVFIKGIMQLMRSFTVLGIIFIGIALILAGILLLFPVVKISSVNLTLLDDTPARATVRVTERGWLDQNNWYSIQIFTEKNANSAPLIQFLAHLEMVDAAITPDGMQEKTLQPGGTTTFSWDVEQGMTGTTPGVLWLYQRDASGRNSLLFAKEFNFQTVKFLGIPPTYIWVSAGMAFLLGCASLWMSRRKVVRIK